MVLALATSGGALFGFCVLGAYAAGRAHGAASQLIRRHDVAYWRAAYEALVKQTGRDLNDGYGIDPRKPHP